MAGSKKRIAKQLPRSMRESGVPLDKILPEGYKISAVLAEFARPYLGDASTLDDVHSVYNIAVIAWNIALMSRYERIRVLMTVLQVVPPDERLLYKSAITELIERKEQYFAEFNYSIASFEVIDKGNRYDLTAMTKVIVDENGEEIHPAI